MLGREYANQNCSVARALEVIGERWSLLIVRDAFLGVTRFEHFQRRLGIASNVLSARLRTLSGASVLERRRYQDHPERFEYVLTPQGKDLFPVIVGMMRWGDTYLATNGPPAVARHSRCEGILDGRAHCTKCGARVGADDAEWHYGPGSRHEPGPRARPSA
jgi:DNA-binding HxlR family transcriptional regulator